MNMKQGEQISVYTHENEKLTGEFRGWDLCPHSERPILIIISDTHGYAIDIDKDDIKGIGRN